MKKCYTVIILFLLFLGVNAQVGINTQDPKATLDVQAGTDENKADGIIPPRVTGDQLRLNTDNYGADQDGAIVYVTTPITVTTEPKTAGITSRGLYIYDHEQSNSIGTGLWQILPDGQGTPTGAVTGDGAYAAKFNGDITLLQLGLGLFDNNFLSLPLSTTNSIITNEIASPQIINNEYFVPSSGLYQINYSYRTDQGLSAQLLSGGDPGVAILKIAAGVGGSQDLLDFRIFGGINLLGLVNVTLTQGQISHIYNLQAGEKLRFGILKGGVNLTLLASRSAEISIYKIK